MTAVAPSTEEQIPVGASTKAEVRSTRSWKAPIAYAFFSALVLVVFGLLAPAGASSTIDLNSDGVPLKFDPLVLPTMVTNLIIGVILAGITVVAFLRTAAGNKLPMWVMTPSLSGVFTGSG